MRIAAAILLILLPGASAGAQSRGASASGSRAPRVGNLSSLSEVSKTVSCGFYFQSPTKDGVSPSRYVFVSQADGRDAWMNLDGRDTRLQLVSISPYPRERIGARRRIDYRAPGGYRVRVETRVTGLSNENEYEPTRFRVTLRVSRRGRATVARAVGYAGR